MIFEFVESHRIIPINSTTYDMYSNVNNTLDMSREMAINKYLAFEFDTLNRYCDESDEIDNNDLIVTHYVDDKEYNISNNTNKIFASVLTLKNGYCFLNQYIEFSLVPYLNDTFLIKKIQFISDEIKNEIYKTLFVQLYSDSWHKIMSHYTMKNKKTYINILLYGLFDKDNKSVLINHNYISLDQNGEKQFTNKLHNLLSFKLPLSVNIYSCTCNCYKCKTKKFLSKCCTFINNSIIKLGTYLQIETQVLRVFYPNIMKLLYCGFIKYSNIEKRCSTCFDKQSIIHCFKPIIDKKMSTLKFVEAYKNNMIDMIDKKEIKITCQLSYHLSITE